MIKTQAGLERHTNSVDQTSDTDTIGEMDRTLDELFALVNALEEKVDNVVNGLVGGVSLNQPTLANKTPSIQTVSGLIPNATQRMNIMISQLHTMHDQMNRLR